MISMYKVNVNIITFCIAPKTQKISKANIAQLPWHMLIILRLYDFKLCFEKFIDGCLLFFFSFYLATVERIYTVKMIKNTNLMHKFARFL